MPEEFSAIIVCPVCASSLDVDEVGTVKFECGNCETEFTVEIDPDKFAEHSLHG